ALAVSIGVLVFLMVRAGGGCRSGDTSAVAEPRTAASAAASAEPGYFGGSKSMGGNRLRLAMGQPGSATAAPPRPAAAKTNYSPGSKAWSPNVDEPESPSAEPQFFPGSKADPHIVRKPPPAPAPAQPPQLLVVPTAEPRAQPPKLIGDRGQP